MKAWLVVLLLALAGCASPESEPNPEEPNNPNPENPSPKAPAGPTGPVNFLLAYDYEDCSGSFFASNPPQADLQAAVPAGYTADTQLLAVILECGNFTTPDVYLPDTWFGFIGIQVEDPNFGGKGLHIYVTEMLAAEDVLAQLWSIAGYATINGTGSNGDNGIPIPVPLLTTSQSCLGSVCFDTTMAPLPLEAIVDDVTLYHESSNYRLQWSGTFDMDFAFDGQGTATFPESSASSLGGAGHGWYGTGALRNNNLIAYYP